MNRKAINDCIDNLDQLIKDNQAKLSSVRRILLSFNSQFIKSTKNEKDSFVYCVIPFIHKVLEKIGIREIIKYRDVNAYLPHSVRKYKIRTTFTYPPNIGKKNI